MATSCFYAILGVLYMTFIIKHEVVALVACEAVSSLPASIPLTCSNNQMIHVISETYGDKGRGEACLDTIDSCTKTFTNDGNGLIVICNGKKTCNEVSMTVSSDCGPKNLTLEIEYECIEGSIDICSPVNISMDGPVYLHSPGFPGSVGVNGRCHCNITGSLMTIMFFEHRAGQGVFTLSTDNTTTWSRNFTHYNRVISSLVGSVFLNYDNYNMSGENVWIRVTGADTTSVTCWRENTNAPVTEPTSTSSSRYPTSSIQHTTDSESTTSEEDIGSDTCNSDSNTVTLVTAICGVIILVLLIVISLLVYFKVIKPAGNTPSKMENANITEIPNNGYTPCEDVTDSNMSTERQGSRDTSNTYNDLSPYENTGGVHAYGKIHAYTNTGQGGVVFEKL